VKVLWFARSKKEKGGKGDNKYLLDHKNHPKSAALEKAGQIRTRRSAEATAGGDRPRMRIRFKRVKLWPQDKSPETGASSQRGKVKKI